MARRSNEGVPASLKAMVMSLGLALLAQPGCAMSPDEIGDAEELADPTEGALDVTDPGRVGSPSEMTQASAGDAIAATQPPPPSFLRTCRGTNQPNSIGYRRDSSGRIVEAWAHGGCQRFNGSWGGGVHWSGSCSSDVWNCNGNIGCPPSRC